ncbi:hypothetical protein ACLKA6_002315 [Drosophila palustris]
MSQRRWCACLCSCLLRIVGWVCRLLAVHSVAVVALQPYNVVCRFCATTTTTQRSATSRNTLVCVCESTVRQPGSNDNSNQATAQRSATSCNTFECASAAVVPVSPVECIHGHRPAAAKTTREVCVPRGSSGTLSTSSGPSPVYQAWEHQSPVRGPSYRHTDSLPTDPTWRPDLRGVEGILGRRDIVIRFLLSGLHPLAPPGRSELAPKIWRRKARGERRNGSRESLLVLLDQSWVRSQVTRADFSGGNFSLSADALAALSSPAGPEKLAALVRRTAEDFGYCFQIARAWEGEARSRRWYSRSMNRELRYREMRYHGAPALPISMEPSGRTGVEPPPNSPRRSTDSQSTDPNTVNPGVMPTWSQADSDVRDAALELEAARGAADWGQVDWVAAPASWRLQGLYGLVPVSLLTAVFRVRGHACGRDIRVRIRTSGRLFRVRIQQNGAVAVTYVPSD